MTPVYLKFANEQEAQYALTEAGLAKDDGKGVTHYASGIDFIGSGRELDKTANDGSVKSHTGTMVNYIGDELPAGLKPYRVYPTTPMQVFAGYSPDEIAAREQQ